MPLGGEADRVTLTEQPPRQLPYPSLLRWLHPGPTPQSEPEISLTLGGLTVTVSA
jgi:hypothetical protein